MSAASNSEARKRATNPVDPVEIVERELNQNGASAGEGIHSWRCEYPEMYGACECVEETARDIITALRAEGLLK
jgi:hypothetical protein